MELNNKEVENVCSEVLFFCVRWSDLSPADHIVPSDRRSESDLNIIFSNRTWSVDLMARRDPPDSNHSIAYEKAAPQNIRFRLHSRTLMAPFRCLSPSGRKP